MLPAISPASSIAVAVPTFWFNTLLFVDIESSLFSRTPEILECSLRGALRWSAILRRISVNQNCQPILSGLTILRPRPGTC